MGSTADAHANCAVVFVLRNADQSKLSLEEAETSREIKVDEVQVRIHIFLHSHRCEGFDKFWEMIYPIIDKSTVCKREANESQGWISSIFI